MLLEFISRSADKWAKYKLSIYHSLFVSQLIRWRNWKYVTLGCNTTKTQFNHYHNFSGNKCLTFQHTVNIPQKGLTFFGTWWSKAYASNCCKSISLCSSVLVHSCTKYNKWFESGNYLQENINVLPSHLQKVKVSCFPCGKSKCLTKPMVKML